jgi:leucyl/phenylalanyl-tRNA--protein transferase
LLAAGGDLSPQRLLAAYRRGIFPWYSVGQPILWWSPDPRAVLYPSQLKVSRSLAKTLRNRGFETRVDTAFREVIAACGSKTLRPDGTWLSPDMMAAYTRLYEAGYAHSVESWLDGRLVGGLYGVSLGRMFYGESMFTIERDASKVALKRLCDECLARGIELIDCQMETPHLISLGATLIPRVEFMRQVADLVGAEDGGQSWASDGPARPRAPTSRHD